MAFFEFVLSISNRLGTGQRKSLEFIFRMQAKFSNQAEVILRYNEFASISTTRISQHSVHCPFGVVRVIWSFFKVDVTCADEHYTGTQHTIYVRQCVENRISGAISASMPKCCDKQLPFV